MKEKKPEEIAEQEALAFVDALAQDLATLRDGEITAIEPVRYATVLQAKAELEALLGGGAAKILFHPLVHAAALSAEADELMIHDPQRFAALTVQANNFEIYPLTNGKLGIALMFYGVLIPVGRMPKTNEKEDK